MANEDIITGLNNAVSKGESLEDAMQIMINSGYDSREVHEASKYVGKGIIPDFHQPQTKPQEMPNQTSLKPIYQQNSLQQPPAQSPSQSLQQSIPQTPQQNNQQPPSPTPMQPPSNNDPSFVDEQVIEKPLKKSIQKESHKKEIILVLILIFLIGLLAVTIFFRDNILSLFS